jgi:hypothetical protein
MLAECQAKVGNEALAVLRAGGGEYSQSAEYQEWLLETAQAMRTLGRFAEAEPVFSELFVSLSGKPEEYMSAGMAGDGHVNTLVALKRFAEAEQANTKLRAAITAANDAGRMRPVDYYNFMRSVDFNTREILLSDPRRAHLAFDLTAAIAEQTRESRETGLNSVRAETNYARILAFNGDFMEAADAAWARLRPPPGATLPPSRRDAEEVAFAALQDVLTDRTSLALAYAMAERSDFGGGPAVTNLIRKRRELLEALAPLEGVHAKSRSSSFDSREQVAQSRGFDEQLRLRQQYRAVTEQLQALAPEYSL